MRFLIPGKLEQRRGQMTVARRVLVEVVLMVLLRRIEILQRQLLYSQRHRVVRLFLGIHLVDRRQVLRIRVIDAGTITRTLIVSLLSLILDCCIRLLTLRL